MNEKNTLTHGAGCFNSMLAQGDGNEGIINTLSASIQENFQGLLCYNVGKICFSENCILQKLKNTRMPEKLQHSFSHNKLVQ